jgi:hypothetical protein
MLTEHERVQMVQEASAGEEVGACLAEFPRRTSTQNELPAALVAVVQVLDRVEDRGDRLHFVYEDEAPLRARWERPAQGGELPRAGEMACPLCGVGKIDPEGILRKKRVQEG